MIDPAAVDLARLQFAMTAMYHFLFVPLTLGTDDYPGHHGNSAML